ncbi:beta-(1,2)-xylosyltransferase [Lingula anatina]|uniref:EGF domain-specific O-linked N-acetylglucosamine transferase n=1 Tax=Lingula anatina TaxID=7574 RepID=A0A1S3IE95_LINAN|nr:beta-(1,2)-xylosyltransferase [Lingula anatina]XP_013396479.1 beta-(1,2)-xylosyltransferase [Lingula anatina]|eukprot:XP_013396478.1 beta-(1,2)-xylosyltransferase [Lingula anatina]
MVLFKEKCLYLMIAGMVNYILGLGVVLWKISHAPVREYSKGCLDCARTPGQTHRAAHGENRSSGLPASDPNFSHCGPFKDPQDTVFGYWNWKKVSMCDGHLIAYRDKFALLRNVIVDRKRSKEWSVAGIAPDRVPHQKEENEFISIKKGFFQILCSGTLTAVFNETQMKRMWLQKTMTTDTSLDKYAIIPRESKMTIIVTRFGYANAYWAIVDMYNAFLLQNFFGKSCTEVKVLLLDSHPWGAFDGMWNTVFGKMLRLTDLHNVTLFKTVVWGMQSNQSPMLRRHMPHLPFVRPFRETMLHRHGVRPQHSQACKTSKLNVLFIWRHDYVAHPRNPSGRVTRKIANEGELLNHLQKTFPSFNISGIQLDKLTIANQLQLVSATDILIAMHGAALAFTVFMTPGSGVIELYPKGHGVSWHFENLARWNGVHYTRWQNVDFDAENQEATFIPPAVASRLVRDMSQQVCPE